VSSLGAGRSTIVLIPNSAPIVDCVGIGAIESSFMRTLHGNTLKGDVVFVGAYRAHAIRIPGDSAWWQKARWRTCC